MKNSTPIKVQNNTSLKITATDQSYTLEQQTSSARGDARKDKPNNLVYFVNAITYKDKYGYQYEQSHLGTGITVEYSFATTPDEESGNGFRQFSARQKKDIRAALDRYAKFTNLKFTEVGNNSKQIDFTFYYYDFTGGKFSNASGYAYYGGNVYLNTNIYKVQGDDYFSPENKGFKEDPNKPGYFISAPRGFSSVLHEVGHSLGFKHPFESPSLQEAGAGTEDNEKYTVMSYLTTDFDAPQQLGLFDIAAAQYLYGVNPNYHGGNDTYTLSDKYISDGGGMDTLDASAARAGVYINLTAGSWLYEGAKASLISAANQSFIGYWTIIENGIGSSYADTIFGNMAANNLKGKSGNDAINGSGGNDILNGNAGRDTLTGGTGNDIFIFNATPNSSNIDTITDFTPGKDKLQLNRTIFARLAGMKKLAATSFAANAGGKAKDKDDYLVYNTATGVLSYDADGSGAGAAVQIAILKNKAMLHAEDIQLSGNVVDNEDSGNNGNTGNTGNTNIIQGTIFNDIISGTAKDDLINGLSGNDFITGKAGKDTLNGGIGRDFLQGNQGNDWLTGGQGSDTLYGGKDNDSLDGGTSADLLFGNNGNDSLNGGEGKDFLQGNDGNDFLAGGLGSDTLYGGKNNDTLKGDAGMDLLFGNKGNDSLNGGEGKDFLQGNDGNDFLAGGLGSDTLYGGKNNDTLDGGAGTDLLFGNKGNDVLNGGNGKDFLQGNGGADSLHGDAGDDILYGGKGNDTLAGGAGTDILYGNKGNDTFILGYSGSNIDTIADFISREDRIQLNKAFFTELENGELDTNLFAANATGSAVDADDRILYNTKTGALFYDADGTGHNAAVQIATLQNKSELKATDLFIAAA